MQGDGAARGLYVELSPLRRHCALVDHIFMLRDHGALTGAGRSVFASPFREIALVGHDGGQSGGSGPSWQVLQASPRFGRQARATALHGWMIGVRADPLATGLEALPDLLREGSRRLGEIVASRAGCDAIVAWLDGVLDAALTDFPCAREDLAGRARQAAVVGGRRWAMASRGATTVARLADAAGVVPRTLQRQVRLRTGLAPKRYAILRRFSAALHEVANSRDGLADVAITVGYCDQSHMTADLTRHTGSSPSRLRAFARQHDADEAERFFQSGDTRARITLFLATPSADRAMADDRR